MIKEVVINFDSGLELVVDQHFSDPDRSVEWLKEGNCKYEVVRDPGFVSSGVGEAFGDCLSAQGLSLWPVP